MRKGRMTPEARHARKSEHGMALVVSVFVLMMISMVAILAIQNSGDESAAGGRTRNVVRSLYAAEGGVEFAKNRILQAPPNLAPFNLNLGNARTVQSRTRTDATPQPIAYSGSGPPPEGYGINIGVGYTNELYVVAVTSSAIDGGTVELEVKLGKLESGTGGY